MMERISITVEKEVLENFDKMRGMVPRSAYINQLMSAEITKITELVNLHQESGNIGTLIVDEE